MPKKGQQLGQTKVSRKLHELVKQTESRAMKMEAATYYKERDEALALLQTTRKELYAYVADLERQAGVEQTITLRF